MTKSPEQRNVEQLGLMLEFEQMVAARVGAPGCAARLKAADNVLALTWAIETLRPIVVGRDAAYAAALTMDDARRNAGLGNFVGTTGTWPAKP